MKHRFLPLVALLALLMTATLLLVSCGGNDTTTAESTTTVVTTTELTTTTPVTTEAKPEFVSAIFGGNPFTNGYNTTYPKIKDSGFNTYIIWSVHLDPDTGDLFINDIPVVKDGKMISPGAKATWGQIRKHCTNITRIEISIDAWGTDDFKKIKKFIELDPAKGGGTGEDSILYKNFKALIEASGADAVNFDDESCYDVESAYEFAKMCERLGCKVTLCPYTAFESFWIPLYKKLGPELCDRVYVQCYVGGVGNKNNLIRLSQAFGCDLIPGYYCRNTERPGESMMPDAVANELKKYINYVEGGFMWQYDVMENYKTPESVKDYGTAISEVGESKKWD